MDDVQKPRAGFAVLIGRSNVGKSTLMNALVGSKIAITTPKPQTTRKPVQGILSTDRGQAVFIDTPGVFKQSNDPLSKKLLKYVRESLKDVDVIVYVVDPTRSIGSEEKYTISLMENAPQQKLLVINKMDIPEAPFLEDYRALAKDFDAAIELSAQTGKNVNVLRDAILDRLPEGEPFYPIGQLTNMPNEEWIAELIREKLFLRLRQEVPYTLGVVVDEVTRRENDVLYIAATIMTNADRYRKMIIGKGGQGIKEIGQSTRKELEAVTNVPVFLDLHVETNPDWMEQLH